MPMNSVLGDDLPILLQSQFQVYLSTKDLIFVWSPSLTLRKAVWCFSLSHQKLQDLIFFFLHIFPDTFRKQELKH